LFYFKLLQSITLPLDLSDFGNKKHKSTRKNANEKNTKGI